MNNRSSSSNNSRRQIGGTNSNMADVNMDVAARGLRKARKALPDYAALSLPAGVPMGMRVVPDVPANVATVRQATGSGRDDGRDNGRDNDRDILRRSGEVSGDDTVAVSIRNLGGLRTGSLSQLLDEPVDVLPDYGPLQSPPDGPVGMLAVQEVPAHAAAAPQPTGRGHHNGQRDGGGDSRGPRGGRDESRGGRDFGRPSEERSTRPPRGRAAHQIQRCGNCNGINHTVAVCVHPAPDGFVHGCPICNSGSHESVDLCPKATRWPKTAKKQKWVDLAIKSRGNRPPLAAAGHWLDLLERACQDNLELPAAFPWMPGFLPTLADRFQPETMPWVGHDYVADLPRSLPVDHGTLDIDTIMSNIDVLRAGLTGALNARVHQGPWPVWNGRHDALPRRL